MKNQWSNKDIPFCHNYLNVEYDNYHQDEFIEWLDLKNSPASVLDVGCCNGNICKKIKNKFINYTGIDINWYNIKFAKENHTANFIFGDIEKSNINYDVIYFDSTLCFLKNPESLLKRIRKNNTTVFLSRTNIEYDTKKDFYTWSGMNNKSENWTFSYDFFIKCGFSIIKYKNSYILE